MALEEQRQAVIVTYVNLMRMLDGELRETQTANYFSDVYPIDCTVSPANALFCRKNGTLLQAGNLL